VHPANATRAPPVIAQERVVQDQKRQPRQHHFSPTDAHAQAAGKSEQGWNERLERLRAIVQEGLSPAQLEGLLRTAGGDVESAVNIYLDAQATGNSKLLVEGIEKCGVAVPTVDLAKVFADNPHAAPNGERRGCTLEQWSKQVFSNGSVACPWEESWPKKLGSRHCLAYLTRSLREGFLTRGDDVKLYRPPFPPGPLKGSSKRQLNLIVRFSAQARLPSRIPHKGGGGPPPRGGGGRGGRWETCEGRLPTEIARVLAPLMDARVIRCKFSKANSLLDSPSEITVELTFENFHQSPWFCVQCPAARRVFRQGSGVV